MRLADQEERDAVKLEWQQLAMLIDRILLWLFVALTLTVTGFVLFAAPYSHELWTRATEDISVTRQPNSDSTTTSVSLHN